MSERLLWKENATAAICSPYPDVIGGVPDIRRRENIFLNENGVTSVEVMPRMNWDAPGWNEPLSMSSGYASHADHSKYGTDAWWVKPDPRDLTKLKKRVVQADFVDWHEPALDWNSYMAGLMRAWHPRSYELVTMGTLHADSSEENMRRFIWASRFGRILNFMDIAITNSDYMKQRAERILGSKGPFAWDFEVIPNPIDTTLFTPDGSKISEWGEHKLAEDVVKIFYIGRLENRKGLLDALEAVAMLAQNESLPDFRFIIAGSGPDEQRIRERVKVLHLEDKIIFLGRISDTEKYKAYRSADFCYFPSYSDEAKRTGESFGDVLMEAMASGVPVIAGSAYKNSPVIKHGENGFLLSSRQAIEAAYYLELLIRGTVYRKNLGASAVDSVLKFDSRIVYGQRVDLANATHEKKMRNHAKQKVSFHPYPLAVGTALLTSSYTAAKRVVRGKD